MPTYRYPENVGQPPFDKFIKFDAKKMRHVLRNIPNDPTVASAVLYLPETALRNTTAVAWDTADMGTLAGPLLQVAGRNGAGILKTDMKGAINTLKGAAGAVVDSAKEAGVGGSIQFVIENVLAEIAQSVVPDTMRNAASAFLGTNINPRKEVLFQTPEYRRYQFEFMLVPRNYKEAENIDNIVKFFQFYMLPAFYDNDTIMGYPYEFEVGVFNNTTPEGQLASTSQIKRVAHIGRCIVTSFTADFAAGGKVAFVRDETKEERLFPVATSLSMELQEVKLLSRNDPEILRGAPEGAFPDTR